MYEYSDEAKALRAEIDAAQEERKKALTYWKQSTTPATIEKWKARYLAAGERIVAACKALKEGRRAELEELDDAALAARLASALNYSFEATMSDYSIDSINRAQSAVDDAKEVLEARGYEKDQVVEYVKDGIRSGWRVRPGAFTMATAR